MNAPWLPATGFGLGLTGKLGRAWVGACCMAWCMGGLWCGDVVVVMCGGGVENACV